MSTNNSNASLEYESSQTLFSMRALVDSGDATKFTSAASLFSEADGVAPDIRPNGLITGGEVKAAVSLTNNAVDVAALTCYLAGIETTVAAGTDKTITRPATAVSKVNSITINSSGVITVIAGTDGSTTAFSDTRGAAGGPPFIPVGSIELAQVRVISNTASPITAAQIYAIPGTHQERYDTPAINDINNVTATVSFVSALPLIHTGSVPKGVYGSYAEPIFAEQRFSNDFVPAETSSSVSSTQLYQDVVGSESRSLSQGAFTAILKDGITDPILSKVNQKIWFRFKQNKFKSAHILTQGTLSVGRTFAASENPKVACKISATVASVNRVS